MYRRTVVCALVTLAALTWAPERSAAANKEMQELQRDVAQLQEQLKQLQQSQERQLTEIRVLVQQSLSSSNDANKAVAVIQSGFQQSTRDLENKVVAPVVGLSSRMDQVSSDVRTLQQAMADLTGMISKMSGQLEDLKKEIKVIQQPVAPPPSAQPPGGSGAAPGGQAETPTMSATDLYQASMRDMNGGKMELALGEFNDYLKWYGNTDLAPNAQFYIATIHSKQGDYESAVREFDMVLEKYPDNNKTPDAMYSKGLALVKMGRRTDGAREFQELANRFPKNPLAAQACSQVTSLGFRCTTSTPPATKSAPPKRGKKG